MTIHYRSICMLFICLCCLVNPSNSIAQELKSNGIELEKQFIHACRDGDSKTVRELLGKNINVNFVEEWSGSTPLLRAVHTYGPNMTRLDSDLIVEIAKRSNKEIISAKNWEALFHAADQGLTNVLLELLDKDIDISIERSISHSNTKRNLVGSFLFGEASSYSRIEPLASQEVLLKINKLGFDMGGYKDALLKAGYWKVLSQIIGTTSDEINNAKEKLTYREIEFLIKKDDLHTFEKFIADNNIKINDETNLKYKMFEIANIRNSKKIIQKLTSNGIKLSDYDFYKLLANNMRTPEDFVSIFNKYSISSDVKQQLFKQSIIRKNIEIFNFLLKEGIDVNTPEPRNRFPQFQSKIQPRILEDSMSPLMIASYNNNVEMVSKILSQKNVNVNEYLQNNNIYLLAGNEYPKIFTKSQTYSALFYACMAKGYKASEVKRDVVRMLIESGAEINPSPPRSLPLHAAIMMNDMILIEELVTQGAKLNIDEYLSPLILALKLRRTEVVSYLLENRVDIKIREPGTNLTAADIAAESMQIPFLKQLDFDKKYSEITSKFTPSKNSKYIGSWTNGASEFKLFGVVLQKDGTGYFFNAMSALFIIYWGEKNGELFQKILPVEKRANQANAEKIFHLVGLKNDQLIIALRGKETTLLKADKKESK